MAIYVAMKLLLHRPVDDIVSTLVTTCLRIRLQLSRQQLFFE